MQGGREEQREEHREGGGWRICFCAKHTILSHTHTHPQELLSLFGLPYIVSPTEAEAQCAALDVGGLTQVGR